jgi:hypothetical protein
VEQILFVVSSKDIAEVVRKVTAAMGARRSGKCHFGGPFLERRATKQHDYSENGADNQ